MKKRGRLRAMKKRQRMAVLAVIAWVAFAVAAGLAIVSRSAEESDGVTVAVKLPAELSAEALQGERLFKANCQACHGPNASGTKLGPPLIHDIYNPGHHSDDAFYLAAATGVRQHHWPYGDMPAQPQVTRADVGLIIRFVRELQEANGIVRQGVLGVAGGLATEAQRAQR